MSQYDAAYMYYEEVDLRGEGGAGNHFEDLQTMLFEVELIINNTLLTYVYPNTIEICLAPNYLLIGRQLLATVLSSTTDKINRISNHFWYRWIHEYVVETQQTSKLNIKRWKGTRNFW